MEKYRVAYMIDGKLKFKNINAKNEKTLKKAINRRFNKVRGFSIVSYKKIYDFKYGIYDDISKCFVRFIFGNTPQELIKRAFRVLGNDTRKQRYRIKPFDLDKESQTTYNQKIQKFDKDVTEEEVVNGFKA